MKELKIKKQRTVRRLKRNRAKVITESRITSKPRLSVFRSNRYLYAQIIDDIKGLTLISASEKEVEVKDSVKKVEKAAQLGSIIAKKARDAGIKEIIFDKGAYKYHGRIKSFAEAAREGGLNF